MKTTEQGRLAETAAANFMKAGGFRIIGRNWRRPNCEIDVIAEKGQVIYFIEVKFRSGAVQGDGFEYITDRKLRQMEFAARNWCSDNSYDGDWRLMAAAVSGPNCQEVSVVEL